MLMQFSNYQILASVVSTWVRPAISQIAFSKVTQMPFMQNLQGYIVNTGLVKQDYNISMELEPFVQPVMDALVQPMLEKYFANVPDSAIPQLAHNIVEEMKRKGTYGILDNLVVFDQEDILELENLLIKNLPIANQETYQVIR